MKRPNNILKALAWGCVFALIACGRTPELHQDGTSQFEASLNEHLGDSRLSDPEVHDEIRLVMNEIQTSLFTAFVPDFAPAIDTRALGLSKCKPKFRLVMVGAGIEFSPTNGCPLSGTIALKLFPITAVADLDVVGLKHVQRIQFDAEAALGGNSAGVRFDLTVLDARFSLGSLPLLPSGEVGANAKIQLQLNRSSSLIDSRINAFETASGLGVALVARINRVQNIREVQGCLLRGAVPTNPNAGTLSACFRLGGRG